MLLSADKVRGWVKKGQKHADVILERPLTSLSCPYGPKLKIHVGNWAEATSVI